jgi:pimeloyl-ACP methyl ester carboxylesterase
MLNMPGRGQSKRWNKSDGPIENFYSVERYTDTLFALIQRIGEPVTLAGWSMGAIVALRYAQKYGLDAVDQLILLSGVAKVDGNCSSFRGRTVSEVVIEAQNRSEAAGMFNVADPIAVAHTWFSLQHLDFRGTLSSIDKPTVVIHGTNDAECPASQGKFMAERIPSAVWVPLEQIDHFVLKLAPEEIVMAIQNNRCSH